MIAHDVLAMGHVAQLCDILAADPNVPEPSAYARIAAELRSCVRDRQPLASPLRTRDYFTMKEAASITGLSVRTLERHGLPSTRVGGRRIVSAPDLATWMKEHRDG